MAVASATRILEVRVEEATGCNKDHVRTWDSEITEGFVKAEVRGRQGSKPVKQTTNSVQVSSDVKMTWQQALYFEITEESTELRLLLCREKKDQGKKSNSVLTACGIFISDIVEAAPIDKYFEMFKPGSGKEGGFVRLKLNILTEEEMRQKQKEASDQSSSQKGKPKHVIAVVVVAIALGGILLFRRQQKKDEPKDKKK